jgi:hypothetical protein
MDANRLKRARDAAIAAQHKNREDYVRDSLAECRRTVARIASASGGMRSAPADGSLRYSEPVETPPSTIYKAHDPDPEHRRSRRRRSEPAPAAAASPANEDGVPEWQVPWERWMRAHLDNERARTDAAICDVVKATVEALEMLAESRDDSLKKTRDELASLRLEVAKFASLVDELRTNAGPVDLPARSLREVN